MRSFFINLILLISCLPVFAQYKFTLDIKSQTLSDKEVILSVFNNGNYTTIQKTSFFLRNGHYILNGDVKQPSNFAAFFVSYKGKTLDVQFVLDSGKNHISLDLPVEESRYLTLQSDARGNFIFRDLQDLFMETVDNYKEPVRVNGYLKITPEFHDHVSRIQLKRLETYPNDFGSLIYLYRMSRMDALPGSAKNNLATLAKFSDELRNSELGKQLYTEETGLIKNKILASAGNEVMNFTITDINNKPFNNTSLKGQPYIIVFSATWCGPCQQELPTLKMLYDKYKQKGLKVIYFNDDDDVIRWKKHVAKNKLTWINVSEKLKPRLSKIPRSFGVYSIPTCLVIDKRGTIVYNSDESDPGISKIERYIKKVVYD